MMLAPQLKGPVPGFRKRVRSGTGQFSLGAGVFSVRGYFDNRDFPFFVFERTKHQPRRNLRSYFVLQRLCNEAALSPGIDAFWY